MKKFLKCSEAAHLCNKSQYKEVGFGEKIILRIHLAKCKTCRDYSKRNVKLTQTIKSAKIKTLGSEEKQHLKMQFEQELNKESSA
ncbi:MAG: hypothetical protein ACTIJ9_07595 [Aequorivita sp.]